MGRVLKVGMLGCGDIAYKSSGPSIKKSRNTEMIVAMDLVEHVAESFGEEFGIPATTCPDVVLEND